MNAGGAAVATTERLMGHATGPIPDRLRGDPDLPAVLVGVVPAVHAHPSESGVVGRISDVFDRVCLMVTFVLWVVLPVLGIIGLIAGR
ncbi:hypothetical protein ABIB25_004090 [Nakamurella sp. UYEF19]|uniref:hypothetical protein n=1 Tax=Nakamurella sp. UYEF19 TaxID=1756392 RepID=UPI0033966BA2